MPYVTEISLFSAGFIFAYVFAGPLVKQVRQSSPVAAILRRVRRDRPRAPR